MRLLKIIEKAKEKNIMPVLAKGVYLKIKGNYVYAVNQFNKERKTFYINDGTLSLATYIKLEKDLTKQQRNGYWEEIFEMQDILTARAVNKKIGEEPELFNELIFYTDVHGKKQKLVDQRRRVVPVYKDVIENQIITTIKFEGEIEETRKFLEYMGITIREQNKYPFYDRWIGRLNEEEEDHLFFETAHSPTLKEIRENIENIIYENGQSKQERMFWKKYRDRYENVTGLKVTHEKVNGWTIRRVSAGDK